MSTGFKLPIFISLMKIVKPHIFRTFTISLLMAGFMAHLLMPFSSSAQKTAFTKWLDHNVVASGNENEVKIRNIIRGLPDQSGDFRVLVQQASELVSKHRNNFKIHFSFEDNEEKQRVSSWLIGQWNVFQNHQSGRFAIFPEGQLSMNKWISPNSFSTTTVLYSSLKLIRYHSFFGSDLTVDDWNNRFLIPLKNGISINAP